MNVTQMVLNLGEQMHQHRGDIEQFKREMRVFIAEMQHMKGSFEAHMERTNRILDFLMRRVGPDSAA